MAKVSEAPRFTGLPTLEQVQAERLRRNRARAHANLLDFIELTTPGWMSGHVHRLVCAKLQQFYADAMERRSPRLILAMAPRLGKSTMASQRGPVWAMGRYPGMRFISATYGQDLSDYNSRLAREVARSRGAREVFPHLGLVREDGVARNEADRVRDWEVGGTINDAGVESRGQYKATSVGGSAAGRGAHVVSYDDLVKDHAEAASKDRRDYIWDWMGTVGDTRLEPGGGKLLTMTRWHEDDPVGRIKRLIRDGLDKEGWIVLEFPALGRGDDDWRAEGESVHPERWSAAELRAKRDAPTMTPYFWSALYQQEPVPTEGSLIKPHHLAHKYTPIRNPAIRKLDRVSSSSPFWQVPGVNSTSFRVVSADTATKAGELNDFTAIGSAVEIEHLVHLADVQRRRLEFPALCDLMHATCERDDPHVVLIEDKGSGSQLIQQLPKRPGWRWSIVPVVPKVDKHTRMAAETPWLESARLLTPVNAPWSPDFDRELLAFPSGTNDDQVDMLSQMLAYLRVRGAANLRSLYTA